MNKTSSIHPDDTLTSGEVAKLCGVNFRTVIRWAEKGLFPAYRLPGRGDYRIKASDLTRFLSENGMPLHPDLIPQQQRALIIDDEVPMAAAIERCLRRQGFETEKAHNGVRAGVLIATFEPTVITLDLRMPGLDGFDVLALLTTRAMRQTPKIIVVSAEPQERLQLALAQGADAVLSKPFTNEELLQVIDAVLTR